jgi:hypothetical protein
MQYTGISYSFPSSMDIQGEKERRRVEINALSFFFFFFFLLNYIPSKHPSHGFPVGRIILAASNIDLAIMISFSENATCNACQISSLP